MSCVANTPIIAPSSALATPTSASPSSSFIVGSNYGYPKFNYSTPFCKNTLLSPRPQKSAAELLFRFSNGSLSRNYTSSSSSSSYKSLSPVMQWQDCTVKREVDVPASVAYNCYSDRESTPQWMPFISSVKVLKDEPDVSQWSLKYKAFGRDIEFSWLARNLQPIPNQKIHWTSLEGLVNRGAVRFFPKDPSSCTIELTVSYEVPQILVPVASALQPFLDSLLTRGLERFSRYVKGYQPDTERP